MSPGSEHASTRPRRLVRSGVLTITVVAVLLLGLGSQAAWAGTDANANATANGNGGNASAKALSRRPIVLVGETDPRRDVDNLNAAIAAGAATGRTVQLVGHFDVGDRCIACVQIRRPVTIVGTGDPSVPSPNPANVTIIEGGKRGGARAPFAVNMDRGAPAGSVVVSRLWFQKATLVQLVAMRTNADTKMTWSSNRFTGLNPTTKIGGFRFAMAAANPLGTISLIDRGIIETKGDITLDRNFVNNTDVPFPLGDDNACGFARWEYDHVVMTNNTLIQRGECEFEGGFNPNATLVASGNVIFQNATRSPQGALFNVPSHPTALKLNGNEAKSQLVENNFIRSTGSDQAICMMVTNVDTPAGARTATTIRNNTCEMNGTGTAIAGCSLGGTELFYPPGVLQNAVIADNTIRGTARFGIAFYSFAGPASLGGMICTAYGNQITGNDMSGFSASQASLFFGLVTHDNVFVGNTGTGRVLDLGARNTITTSSIAP